MIKQIFWAAILLLAVKTILFAGLMVTPTRAEITLPPGGTYEGVFHVTNDLGHTALINVTTGYWYVSAEEKNVPISDWVEVDTMDFTFNPGETRDYKYRIQLSTSAVGMRSVMFTFMEKPQAGVQGISLLISVSLYVTAAGTERKDWDFENFTISSYQGNTQFSVYVRNSGNVHVRPNGFVKVIKGKKETTLEIPESRPAYPNQRRQAVAHGVQKEVFPKPGKYKVIVSLTGTGITKEKTYEVQVKKTGEVVIIK